MAGKPLKTHTPGTGPRELHRGDEKPDDPADASAVCRTIPRIFYSATGWGKGGSVQGGRAFPGADSRAEMGPLPAAAGFPKNWTCRFSPNQGSPLATQGAHAAGWVPSKVLRQFGRTAPFRNVGCRAGHGREEVVWRQCGLRWLPNKSETSRPHEGQPILLFRPIPPPAPCSPSPATACMRQADS